MVKLIKILPKSRKEDEMNDALNETVLQQHNRGYNGLSGIGAKCTRALQFDHYNATTQFFSSRMIRLFGEGHRMEPVLIEAITKYLGIEVTDQQKECIGFAGHWKGHIDGIGQFRPDSKFLHQYGKRFLLEFKTHKASSFSSLLKNGVKKDKPGHYGQMTSYMGYNKLTMCLYIAYNKDTSEIYTEWVEFDPEYFKELKRKEAEIITADSLLPRIGNNSPMWVDCKMCHRSNVCFGKEVPHVNCKTCEYVDVLEDGAWKCSKNHTLDDSFTACEEYELMRMLYVD